MIININAKELLSAVQFCSNVAGTNKNLPILNNVYIEAEGFYMRISAYNGNAYVCNKLALKESVEKINYLVNPVELSAILSNVTTENIELDFSNNILKISHGFGYNEIPFFSADEYPFPSMGEVLCENKVKISVLHGMIKNAAKFTSNNELHPVLHGIYIYFEKETMGVVSSNARVLFWDEIHESFNVGSRNEAIIPGRYAKDILNAINKSEDTYIKIYERGIMFHSNTSSVYTSHIEGKYPNFRAIVPHTEDATMVKVDKNKLCSAIRLCMTSSSISKLVKLSINNYSNNLELSSEDIDYNKKGVTSFEADVKNGQNMDIGLNGEYLILSTLSFTTDMVEININNPQTAIVLTGDNEQGRKIVLMPMNL